ncbi:Hsp20/alpha crystallin family protein [Halobacteria archaeon AArc-curdl1]|uniref:Hsp20/alpha crystallin family protein n=1 Tax=Natronosalvus hydrolyticus TaxID=2979988 RepID=A0AAP3E661_9EURY|nr:Hsp20/alpha crystallin family protein [Halobacteria archaeon AArc-curdl1]
MKIDQFARDDDRIVRRYQYDDGTVLAVDFGGVGAECSVDVVDGTVIVVVGDEQYELDIPVQASDAQAFMRNGVLTVELEASL